MKFRSAAVIAGLTLGSMSGAAQASYILDIQQVGADVAATGRGSIDLSNASLQSGGGLGGFVFPGGAVASVGGGFSDVYSVALSGPDSFGDGGPSFADTASGLIAGIAGGGDALIVPVGYVSGRSLGTSTATFDNTTIADLGLIAGSYLYTFQGTGTAEDSFTVNIGVVSTVPLPSSAPLFGAAVLALGLAGCNAKRKNAAVAA